MLDIKFIREDPQKVKEGIRAKGVDDKIIDEILQLDTQKRELLQNIEKIRAKKNSLEEKLISLSSSEKEEILKVLKEAKELLTVQEGELEKIDKELFKKMTLVPNLPLDYTPLGADESQNIVIKEKGQKPIFSFTPKDYLTLGEQLDIIDVNRASKISGSRFGFLKREGALLEIALVKFVFDRLSKKNFIPIIPPVLIKREPFWGMGYLDRGEEETYYLPKDELYLVGTAEQMIGPMHMNETFKSDELPRRYVAFSSCFRREAGSYGKDTKGILRVHQFDKVEMFIFAKPEEAKKEHELLLSIEEELMQSLGIPYRVLNICSGDLGDPAAAKFDIEAWLPGQNNGQGEYRETHSTSNCTDFQARRLNIKYYDPTTNKNVFVYTLNGTALAIGRTIIAIIENYQTKEGFIRIPRVLIPYMNGIKLIKR